jgi:hypothetical protein
MKQQSRFGRWAVLKHEQFEELCAAASIGQVNGTELAELREHLEWCSSCKERYSEFLNLNAAQYAKNARGEELTREEAVGSIDSALFRERFLKKAAAEGIVFSGSPTEQSLPDPRIRSSSFWNWPVFARAMTAVAVLTIVAGVGYYVGTQRIRFADVPDKTSVAAANSADEQSNAAIASLEAENQSLSAEIASLKTSLGSTSSRLFELQANGSVSERERLVLISRVKEREEIIASLQSRLDQAQASLTNIRADYDKAQQSLSSNQVAFVETQVKLHDLSDQLAEKSNALAREREMLNAGRDVRDLMSARNLHIVDVFDTDPKGKTRPAFGRIFLTEGKSLLFYAYDMPDGRLKQASFQYRIWGKKEGPNQRARNLGIFFSDDKSQKRWVFQYDDPKVLSEIDSVFVTLEPSNGDPNKPNGNKLMYAYLRGQANHP